MANPLSTYGLGNFCRHCLRHGCLGQCQQASANQQKAADTAQQRFQASLQHMQLMANPSFMQPQDQQRVPLPQEEIVCATGGIVGWRAWRVPCFGDDLRSFNGELWPVREALRATCKSGAPQDCRGEYCTCGLYAWKDRGNLTTNKTEHNALIGEVWMWGKIIEHEKGYRAEYSYPKAFVNSGPDARRLARIYGVKLIEA